MSIGKVKQEDFDSFLGFVSQVQLSRPDIYGGDNLTDEKIMFLIDEFYNDKSKLKAEMLSEAIKTTNIAGSWAGNVIDRIIANNPVFALNDYEQSRALNEIKNFKGDTRILLEEMFKKTFGSDKSIASATTAQLEELMSQKNAAYLVYAKMSNENFSPVIAKTDSQKKIEANLSKEIFDFNALFNTFINKYSDIGGEDITTGLLYNFARGEALSDASLKREVENYMISGERTEASDKELLGKLKTANSQKFEQYLKTLLVSSQLNELISIGTQNGYFALKKDDQEKLVKLLDGNEDRAKEISYFEVSSRLGLTSGKTVSGKKTNAKDDQKVTKNIAEIVAEIKRSAIRNEAISFDYERESDFIELEQLHDNLSKNGTKDVLSKIVNRLVSGSENVSDFELNEDEKAEKIHVFAAGLGLVDVVFAEKLKEDEKTLKKAIEIFERTHTNIKFSALDTLEQCSVYAKSFEAQASADEISSAEIEYITRLISSGAITTSAGKKIPSSDVKQIQNIIGQIMDNKRGMSIDEFLMSDKLSGFMIKGYADETEELRAVIANLDDDIFANLYAQSKKGVTESDNQASEAFDRAKMQIIEQNYDKKAQSKNTDVFGEDGNTLASKIPNVDKLSQSELRDFRFRISLLNRRVNDDSNSEILLNILKNCHFVNEDYMVRKMADMQRLDPKEIKGMTTDEIKAVLLPETVNKFFSENQNLKNVMLQTGASDITLALSHDQLSEREMDVLVDNIALKEEVLSSLCVSNEYHELDAANKKYFQTNGKVKKEMAGEVSGAIKKLRTTSPLFNELIYDDIIASVSYGADEDEYLKFFAVSRANMPIAKNVAEALKFGESTLFKQRKFRKAHTQVSSIIIKGVSHDSARMRNAQELERDVSIILNRVNDFNRNFKGSGREYAEQVRNVLGKYYDVIYNSKNLAVQLLGRPLASENIAVQQREIVSTLQSLVVRAARRMNYSSTYIPTVSNSNDPRFIGGLTRAKPESQRKLEADRLAELDGAVSYIEANYNRFSNIIAYLDNSEFTKGIIKQISSKNRYQKLDETQKVKFILDEFKKEQKKYLKLVSSNNFGRRVDYSKFRDLRYRKVTHESIVPGKMQTELMKNNSEYKALVEKYRADFAKYSSVKEQANRIENELDGYRSPNTPKTDDVKRKIRDAEKVLTELQTRLNILEPTVKVTQEKIRKIEREHAEKFAPKVQTGAAIRNVFDDYNLYGKDGKIIDISGNQKLAKQINDAINSYTSKMASNIDRINKMLASGDFKTNKITLKSTQLSAVVKQASQIVKTLTKEKTELEAKLASLSKKQTEEHARFEKLISLVSNNISRVQTDTKSLENILGKAGVYEIKNK